MLHPSPEGGGDPEHVLSGDDDGRSSSDTGDSNVLNEAVVPAQSDSAILLSISQHEVRMLRDVLEHVLVKMNLMWNDVLPPGSLAQDVEPARNAIVAHVLRIVSGEKTDIRERAARYEVLFRQELSRRAQQYRQSAVVRDAVRSVLDGPVQAPMFGPPSADRVA